MTTREQIPGRPGDKNGRIEHQYTSTKLPSITKDKEPIRKKVLLRLNTVNKTLKSNPVFHPRITVEKKSVHTREPSAKSNTTNYRDIAGRKDKKVKTEEKPKEPNQQAEIQKQRFTKPERKPNTNENQPCHFEENIGGQNGHHDQVSATTSTPLPKLSEDLPIISEPASSPVYTSDDSFISTSEINTEDDIGRSDEESSTNDESNETESFSDSSVPPMPRSASYGAPLIEQRIWRNTSLELDEETTSDSEIEELPVDHGLTHDFSAEANRNRLDLPTSLVRNPNNLPPITSPRGLGLRMTHPEVVDRSQSRPQVSFLNLREAIELRGIGVAIATTTEEHHRPSSVAEAAIPQLGDNNSNMRNVPSLEYHSLPQTMFRTEGRRNRTILIGEASSSSDFGALEPNVSLAALEPRASAPNITILQENLDLIFHTISMQRHSERINSVSPDKENVKPTPDPEKLKRIQASLLEEVSEDEGDLCRICLTGDETSENQLLAPCRCTGSLKYVHKECMKKWLLSKINSGSQLSAVKTCEMCKQNVECDFEDFDVDEHYRRHQESRATLNPSLYLVLLLHLYQQRYEELLRLSNTRDRVNEISRRFSNMSSSRREHSREDDQES